MPSTLLAEVLRAERVESRHTGSFAVSDAQGRLVLAGGEPDRPIYPRSAVKALQALPLLLSGAADRLGLTEAELALACASHTGTPLHTATAAAMLARAGQTPRCLECGTHWPSSSSAARALAAAGEVAGPLHNNCSGKHAGFIATALATGRDPAGYPSPDHPVMRAVTAAMSTALCVDVAAVAPGVDGCAIPTYPLPLTVLAAGFARFGTGAGLPVEIAAAATRIRQAVAAHPVMLAGEGRFDTVVTQALGARAFVKVGAEGVYAGALPELGLGFAVKCDDGATRAAEVAAAALLRHFLGPEPTLDRLAAPVLKNWSGIEVGRMRGWVP